MRSPVGELLGDLAAALAPAGVGWYLFDAQAALVYGAARLTADVDVTVRLPDAMSSQSLAVRLADRGFGLRISDPAFIERTRVIPFVHHATGLPLDVVLAGPGLEDQFLSRVHVRTIEGVQICIASPEDLIVMKILAGRPKDLDDVRAVVAALGAQLDGDYVTTTLTMLEEALAQRDLLAAWRTVTENRRRQI
jgi:hypothetical protein